MSSTGPRNWLLGLFVGVLTLLSLALFMVPAWIIQPFRHQAPGALSLAIAVKTAAPVLTLLTLVGVAVAGLKLWRSGSRISRAGLVLALLLSGASGALSRLNYFEWMFHPIVAAGFLTAIDAHLTDNEMVMAVRFGDDARAYPIRQMGYHHILNDTAGGVPIAVTY